MVETIIVAVGVLVAAIGVFIAWLTYFERRKRTRIKDYETTKRLEQSKRDSAREMKEQIRFHAFKDEMIKGFGIVLDDKLKNYETTSEAKKRNKEIWNKLKSMEESLKEHFDESAEAEKSRLAHDIIAYADELRVGTCKTRVSFLHVSVSYDRYKELGGNHYVDEQYEYIKEQMKGINE